MDVYGHPLHCTPGHPITVPLGENTAYNRKENYLYAKESGDTTAMLVASTASPYKFPRAVLSAMGGEVPAEDFDCVTALEEMSGVTAPANLSALRTKTVRFTGIVDKTEIDGCVEEFAKSSL